MSIHDQAAWEQRYAEKPAIWSGSPNPQLVAEITGRPPGRALDVGSGEGGDAIWLAGQGWDTTGVDFSAVALGRAAQHAVAAGVTVRWQQEDVREWAPPPGSYDLVSSHFMHLPKAQLAPYLGRIAAAVAPGGLLLVVGHDFSDVAAGAHRPDDPDMFFTAGELVGLLAPADWEVLVAELRHRPAKQHEGEHIHVGDAVLLARRH